MSIGGVRPSGTVHNNRQTCAPARFSGFLVYYSKLKPNHAGLAVLLFQFDGLLHYRGHILCFPEDVDNFDGFLDFRGDVKQARIAFFTQNLVCERVDWYNAVALLLQVRADSVAVFAGILR